MAVRKPKTKPKKPGKNPAKKSVKKAAIKSRKVPPVPKGTHTITARMCFQDSAFAMMFYVKAFGAKELYRLTAGGKVGHAEMRIGDSIFTLSDEHPEMGILSAKSLNGSPIRLTLTVKNADKLFDQAVAAGATVLRPMQEEFYGYRSGNVLDPFGYSWMIMTQVAVVSRKEMQKRLNKLAGG